MKRNHETAEKYNRVVILTVLRAVKKILGNSRFYVCTSAQYAEDIGMISAGNCKIFVKFINERIRGCNTVMEYLREYHNVNVDAVSEWEKTKYRQRWVDNMIEEFSK